MRSSNADFVESSSQKSWHGCLLCCSETQGELTKALPWIGLCAETPQPHAPFLAGGWSTLPQTKPAESLKDKAQAAREELLVERAAQSWEVQFTELSPSLGSDIEIESLGLAAG